jgi:hypothetical protein
MEPDGPLRRDEMLLPVFEGKLMLPALPRPLLFPAA